MPAAQQAERASIPRRARACTATKASARPRTARRSALLHGDERFCLRARAAAGNSATCTLARGPHGRVRFENRQSRPPITPRPSVAARPCGSEIGVVPLGCAVLARCTTSCLHRTLPHVCKRGSHDCGAHRRRQARRVLHLPAAHCSPLQCLVSAWTRLVAGQRGAPPQWPS